MGLNRLNRINNAGFQKGSGLDPLFLYKSYMAFWGGKFDFTTNQWLDKSGNDNHATLKNASARTSPSGNLDYTITGVLTSDTVEVVSGSDTPAIPANGTLRIAEGQTVYGVTIKRAGVIWAIIPFCEPKCCAENMPTTSYDVSGNSRHAVCTGLADGNITTQNNYFYLQQYGYNVGGPELLKHRWDFNTWTGEYPNQVWGGLDSKSGGILEPVAGGKAKLQNPYRIREYGVNVLNKRIICTFNVEEFTRISGDSDQVGSAVTWNNYTSSLKSLVNQNGLVNRNGTYRSETVQSSNTNFEITVSGYSTSQSWVLTEPPSVKLKLVVPALLTGSVDALGVALEFIPDNKTWFEFGCDIQMPDNALLKAADQKGCWSDIIAGGYCINGKTYLIETTEENHFGVGRGVHDEFVSDGTQSSNDFNRVRELIPNGADRGLFYTDAGISKAVTWASLKPKRPHFYYSKKQIWEDAKRIQYYDGRINDFVIFKSTYYLKSNEYTTFRALFSLQDIPNDITPVAIAFDHLNNTDLPTMDTLMLTNRAMNKLLYVDYGHALSHVNQIAAASRGDEIGLHTGWNYTTNTFVAGYKDFAETSANYTSDEIRIYWQNCIDHYISKIGIRLNNHAYPGGSAGFPSIAAEYFRTARGASGSGLYNKLPLLTTGGQYSWMYALSSPSLDALTGSTPLNTYKGYLDTAILYKNLFVAYGHPSTWASGVWDYFEQFLDYIISLQAAGTMVRVYTLNTALDMIENKI